MLMSLSPTAFYINFLTAAFGSEFSFNLLTTDTNASLTTEDIFSPFDAYFAKYSIHA